jgi:hypothetical protein
VLAVHVVSLLNMRGSACWRVLYGRQAASIHVRAILRVLDQILPSFAQGGSLAFSMKL